MIVTSLGLLDDGDRVEDADTGRAGTVARGWLTGAVSVEWDDAPGVADHSGEWRLRVEAVPDVGDCCQDCGYPMGTGRHALCL